jgi:hypothetical protein
MRAPATKTLLLSFFWIACLAAGEVLAQSHTETDDNLLRAAYCAGSLKEAIRHFESEKQTVGKDAAELIDFMVISPFTAKRKRYAQYLALRGLTGSLLCPRLSGGSCCASWRLMSGSCHRLARRSHFRGRSRLKSRSSGSSLPAAMVFDCLVVVCNRPERLS